MTPIPAVAPHQVNPSTVVALQSMTSYPSVSLLMPTRPGRLDKEQAARLTAMRDRAFRRITDEGLFGTGGLVARIDELIDHAHHATLDRSLAVFVNGSHSQLLVLPVDVKERVVIDPTFATRDLVRALHRTPRHVVLVLSAQEARLFEGRTGSLAPADGSKFPRVSDAEDGGRPERFLTQVDHALGAYLQVRPAPLIVVAAEPRLSQFCRHSQNLGRLAGKIAGNHLTTPLRVLSDLIGPDIERYLASRQDEALALLEQRQGQDRAVLGVDAVWLATRWERPEMLAVEDDYFFPARISSDGDVLQAAADVEHPDVIDDVVDEVIEQVLARSGWIALVEPGRIPDGARIAMTLRSGSRIVHPFSAEEKH